MSTVKLKPVALLQRNSYIGIAKKKCVYDKANVPAYRDGLEPKEKQRYIEKLVVKFPCVVSVYMSMYMH